MARVDYYQDPDAPKANNIVSAVTAFVRDEQGRVLMIRRTDSGLYAIPGGAQEFGETISETVVRETREESGIDVEVTALIGIYTDPAHVIAYSDSEVRQEFSICFRARPVGGAPSTSDESSEVHWIDRAELDALAIHPSIRLRIEHGFADRDRPYYS